MFKTLRLRFIAIASVAILVVLFSIVTVLNAAWRWQTVSNINAVLSLLADNEGTFPNTSDIPRDFIKRTPADSLSDFRYFSVKVKGTDEVVRLDSDTLSNLSDEEIKMYSTQIADLDKDTGSFKQGRRIYHYQVRALPNNEKLIVVLDTTRYYLNNASLTSLSLIMAVLNFVFFEILIFILSAKVIEPFVANYEKQRRFITNAGHELKTPVAIISANNELIEMMIEPSEWTRSINDQVARLTGLINSLVSLAKLEEQPELTLEDVDFSVITQDATEDFKGLVLRDGKQFVMSIEPNIHVKAEKKALFELVTLLVDNANKYCDENGTVCVRLSRGNFIKKARLDISNTYREGKGQDYSKYFERFYRADESHNHQVSGFGIGLTMAESTVKLFKGMISVSYKDDMITFTVML
ncbi:HAMP domain-containing histidine kinase [Tuanshanicoccus lijuaniae]|uniref:sensor histidine kinase n=1 Tax=Aerococcaceae bacterium zg-1292 TaxID=2774330 RepID=UPI0019350E62|nr:HAMP domain-containing histidine kinase [Aerococcaceae bacterium zg-1292]MBF6626007.1 HAMP domain-containing histidine kinase [Aerococcaceae bacterium zg-BR9]QQA36819.1 HAMP domain-containing histidine kinase [Aerococcaceae bacterium zg-1292]